MTEDEIATSEEGMCGMAEDENGNTTTQPPVKQNWPLLWRTRPPMLNILTAHYITPSRHLWPMYSKQLLTKFECKS